MCLKDEKLPEIRKKKPSYGPYWQFAVKWPGNIPDKKYFMNILKRMRLEAKTDGRRTDYIALCMAVMILEEAISK